MTTTPDPARLAPTAAAPSQMAPIVTSRTRGEREDTDGRGLYLAAAAAALTWAGGLAALVLGYTSGRAPFNIDSFLAAVLAALAIAPFGFIAAAAYAANQGRRLAMEARRTARLSEQLLSPAALAAADAGSMVDSLRGQINQAAEASIQAHETLLALREALALETERMVESAQSASRTAKGLTEMLGRERVEMTQLAVTLDARSASVADAIGRQAQMVRDAADLAEAQLREGQVILAGGASDLAAAAGEAADAARTAGGELSRQVGRLETAGVAVGNVLHAAEEGLTSQRAALVTVAHALRGEQEDFAAMAETRTAQLAEFLTNARQDVGALGEVAALGAQSVSQMINQAVDQFKDLAAAASREREVFVASTDESLGALVAAGTREREALAEHMQATTGALSAAAQEAREAAEVHAEAARARVDQLNEAAFAAGLKADQVFDARLDEAKRLIEQSARLVEDAGQQTANRLEAGAVQARQQVEDLGKLMDDIAERADAMPAQAEARAQEVKDALAQGMDDLLKVARQAAEETTAIDQAFQDRVRRNYEMLSEAVQLMGVVASAAGAAAPALSRPGPLPRMPRAENSFATTTPPSPSPPEALQPQPVVAPPSVPEHNPAPTAPTAAPPLTEDGLRPRLRLTPTATDQEFTAVFNTAVARPTSEPAPVPDEGWTWKELLGGLESEPTATTDAEALIHEIEMMGIDPAALLPKARVEAIAAAVQTGDSAGAREVVRALAPAAIRRLARRLVTDPGFNGKVAAFVLQRTAAVTEIIARDRQGFEIIQDLTTGPGRAYLLLDAAMIDGT